MASKSKCHFNHFGCMWFFHRIDWIWIDIKVDSGLDCLQIPLFTSSNISSNEKSTFDGFSVLNTLFIWWFAFAEQLSHLHEMTMERAQKKKGIQLWFLILTSYRATHPQSGCWWQTRKSRVFPGWDPHVREGWSRSGASCPRWKVTCCHPVALGAN